MIEHEQAEHIGETLRLLLLPGQRKLHWHDESARRRARLASTLAELDMLHLVVVHSSGYRNERSERRRRLCLQRLLHELDQAGVTDVVFEARQHKQNQADRDLLDAMRAKKRLMGALRVRHVPGPQNPILAAADIVCGAVAADRRGDPSYLVPLKPQLTVHTLG